MQAKTKLCLLSLLCIGIFVALVGCTGNQGPAGLTGDDGNPGDPGKDYSIPAVKDQIISVAVFNGRVDAHNGNATVLLTSDQNAELDGSTVIMDSIPIPPIIDGVDDGDDVWGEPLADIDLGRTGAIDNYISNARMRFAYDRDFVYMMVQWDEVASDGEIPFEVGANYTYKQWVFRDSTRMIGGRPVKDTVMLQESKIDDRVSIFWFMQGMYQDIQDWQTNGCGIACHAEQPNGMYTSIDTTKLDIWEWGSVVSDPNGYAIDAVMIPMIAGSESGMLIDDGQPPYVENFVRRVSGAWPPTAPIYQNKLDPNYDTPVSIDEWQVTAYQLTNPAWEFGATIPGCISTYPTSSAADVIAKGHFSDGTWTVEFKRARETGFTKDLKL